MFSDLVDWGKTWHWYLDKKVRIIGGYFENHKGNFVDQLIAKRGANQRPFLHVGMVTMVVLAMVSAPILVNHYPTSAAEPTQSSPSSILNNATAVPLTTMESEKPRRDVIEYKVESGDTLSSIAKKFSTSLNQIDSASIATLNEFDDEKTLHPGDTIKIPPVAGVVVKVKSGDTIYSLAKKYGLESAQSIVDWPYNNFADDEKFLLAAGQELVIPGGVKPEAPRPVILSTPQQNLFARGTGAFVWPASGVITQYYNGYHNGLDIANNIGTPILAADSGRVILSIRGGYNGGWGTYVKIDHGNGLVSLYGHLSQDFVNVGDSVSRGQVIGYMGSTGRSTGPHLHFTVYRGGPAMNPLELLK